MKYPIPKNLWFTKLLITYRFDDALPPDIPQNLFRSVFGNALAEIGGPVDLRMSPYSILFSPKTAVPIDYLAFKVPRTMLTPSPVFLTPIARTAETITLEMVLIGPLQHFLPLILATLQRIGDNGILKKRIKLTLLKVTDAINGKQLLENHNATEIDAPFYLFSEDNNSYGDETTYLKLSFETAVRIKERDKWQTSISFELLWKRILKRISVLAACYGEGMEYEYNAKKTIDAAKKVETVESNLRKASVCIYSGKQQSTLDMPGMRGSVIYKNVPLNAVRLLELGEMLHVGNQVTYGFGKYQISIL